MQSQMERIGPQDFMKVHDYQYYCPIRPVPRVSTGDYLTFPPPTQNTGTCRVFLWALGSTGLAGGTSQLSNRQNWF